MRKHITGSLAAGAALLLTLSACTANGSSAINDESAAFGFHAEGLPIVDKTLTLTFSGQKAPLAPDFNEMELVKQWEKDTNIKINWENLPATTYAEKKNLLLASNELPDAFYSSEFTDQDIATYGANGTLIPLEDLIDQYAPNLSALFEERPEIKAAVTASDGHIYALPKVEELGIGSVLGFWSINKSWLDTLGLPLPKTVDEYEAALLAFKTQDPNGNGKADEIPLSFINNWWCADFGDIFAALGGMPDNNEHRIVRNDEVIYTASQPEYRDAIVELRDWYEQGLIDPESFTQDDKTYLAKGKSTEESLGSYVWWETAEVVGADRADDYVLLPVLKGVDGRIVGHSNTSDIARNAFAITSANKYPSATMRWVDRLYEPEMSALVSWGPEGELIERNADGVFEQKVLAEGVNAGELRQQIAPDGPRVILKEGFTDIVLPEPRALQRVNDLEEHYLPYAEKQWYPAVFFTVDEAEELATIEADIRALVNEKRALWIVQGGIEDEWDGYVSTLESMGLDRMVEIYQDAYDRFIAAQ